jgi:hypothetical protein
MKGEILVGKKAFIHWVKEFSFEETRKWGDALRHQILKTLEGMPNKAVPDNETFFKKIGKPTLDNLDKMLPDGFVSHKGRSKKMILAIARGRLNAPNAAKKHEQNLKLGLETFDQGRLNGAMVEYHLKRSFGEYRFTEPIELALGWLAPFIQPAKQGRFKSKLGNQLMSSGLLISDCMYILDIIKLENDKINALLNQSIRQDIVRFEIGGQSHCDFVLIKSSIIPFYWSTVKEIKYGIYKEFDGEPFANDLRSRWPVIDESKPPNPDDYIGNPNKLAYFDMELDVQVSKKE